VRAKARGRTSGAKAESKFLSAFDALLEYFIYPAVGDLSDLEKGI
jgi:hypothetical protein